MVKIQKISEIEPRLGFTEFDMLKKYRQSFATSELGRLHALFPFSELSCFVVFRLIRFIH